MSDNEISHRLNEARAELFRNTNKLQNLAA